MKKTTTEKKSNKKTNLTIPLDNDTLNGIGVFVDRYKTFRCELVRHMINFSLRNMQFVDTLNKLYGCDCERHTKQKQ